MAGGRAQPKDWPAGSMLILLNRRAADPGEKEAGNVGFGPNRLVILQKYGCGVARGQTRRKPQVPLNQGQAVLQQYLAGTDYAFNVSTCGPQIGSSYYCCHRCFYCRAALGTHKDLRINLICC